MSSARDYAPVQAGAEFTAPEWWTADQRQVCQLVRAAASARFPGFPVQFAQGIGTDEAAGFVRALRAGMP
jgi:hypothetical protein